MCLQVADFYRQHYGPSSLTISIVGDVDPSQVALRVINAPCHKHSLAQCLAASPASKCMQTAAFNVPNPQGATCHRSLLSTLQVRQYAEKYFGSWRDSFSAAPAQLAAANSPSAAPPSSERRVQGLGF